MNAPPRVDEMVDRIDLWRGADITVSPLSGGLTNDNYLVEADGTRYVLRIPGRSTELLAVDRTNEIHNTRAAAEAGVAPRVLAHVPGVDAMVLEFVEGRTMSGESLRSPEMARSMAESLRLLHAGPRFLHDFDMFRLVEFYLGIVEQRDVQIPEGYRDRLGTVGEIERALAASPLPTVPCHNDLLAENYIADGRRLWIVDYEYSGNNDPCFELGNTSQECGFDNGLRVALCEAYFGLADPRMLARMNLFAVMSDVGWTLWGAIQATISALDFDFWDYAVGRWNRAAEALDSPRLKAWLREAAAEP